MPDPRPAQLLDLHVAPGTGSQATGQATGQPIGVGAWWFTAGDAMRHVAARSILPERPSARILHRTVRIRALGLFILAR